MIALSFRFKLLSLIFVGFILFFDQLTKFIAIHKAPCYVAPFLNFVWAQNNGITFGLLPGISPIIVLIGSGIVLLYVVRELIHTNSKIEMMAYSFIIGGAIGNQIDRFLYGYVIDFLDFHLGGFHYPWPFNVADSFIVIGIGILILINFTPLKK